MPRRTRVNRKWQGLCYQMTYRFAGLLKTVCSDITEKHGRLILASLASTLVQVCRILVAFHLEQKRIKKDIPWLSGD